LNIFIILTISKKEIMSDEVFEVDIKHAKTNQEIQQNIADHLTRSTISTEENKRDRLSVSENKREENIKDILDKVEKPSVSEFTKINVFSGKSPSEEEDTKLKQNDSGTLISRGGEFEAEIFDAVAVTSDSGLSNLQASSDIRFFICGSCKNNPILIGSTPKLLPCLHSFCEGCLQERYEKQKKSDEKNTPRLKCPSCGQEFLVTGNEFPTSGFLNNQFVIESTPSPASDVLENHQCTSCDDKSSADSYCMNCNEWLCEVCVSAHQRVKVTKDHIIQEKSKASSPDGNNSMENITKEKPLFCKVHPSEKLKLFCANCDKLTCRDCQLVEHKDHRYQFIDEAASKHREILKKLLQYLQINLGLLKETISEVEKVNNGLSFQGNEIELEIEKAFDCLIDSIKVRKETIIKELKTLVTNKQTLLAKQKKDLTQMRIILEHNHDFADFAVKGGSNVALLYSRKVLGTRLHNLNSLKYRQRPLAATDLKFSMDVDKLCSYFNKIGAVYSQEDMQRKIDHYNSKNNPSNMPRTMTLTSRTYSKPLSANMNMNPIQSITAINKRISESATSVTSSSGYINLCKQGTLGLPNHQTIRSLNSPQIRNSNSPQIRNTNSPQNLSSRQHSSSTSQDMIVLSTSPSPKYNDLSQMAKRDYTAKYLNQLKDPVIRSQPIPRTPVYDKNYLPQSHSNNVKELIRNNAPTYNNTNITKETHSPNWSKMSIGMNKTNTTLEQLRKMVEGTSTTLPNFVPERPKSNKSNHSDGASGNKQSSSNGVIIKEENKSPDAPQNFQMQIQNIESSYFKSSSANHDDQRSESGFDEGQNNEDYCGVCRNGGQLLCCDTCPKVYHLHCHVPVLTDLPSDSWSCGLCANIGQEIRQTPGQKRRYSEQISEWEVKLCEKICLYLLVHSDSLPFHHKVSKIQVPDYYKVISKPMDLNTILTKLNPSHFYHFKSFEDFISDIRLVFSNCFIYNSADSDVCKMGRRLEAFFDSLLQKHAPDINPYPDSDCRKRRKDENLVRLIEENRGT